MNDEPKKPNAGQFQPGNQAAKGHGRPPRAREAAYARIEQEIVTLDLYRQVVSTQLLDALGKTRVNGQIVDNPISTPADRSRAACWIADRVRGKPIEYTRELGNDDADPASIFADYSDEQLAAIEQFIERIGGLDQAEIDAALARLGDVQSDSSGVVGDSAGATTAG